MSHHPYVAGSPSLGVPMLSNGLRSEVDEHVIRAADIDVKEDLFSDVDDNEEEEDPDQAVSVRKPRRGVLYEPQKTQRSSQGGLRRDKIMNWGIFVKQLCYHLFGFFAVPIMLFTEGPTFMANTLFLPMRRGSLKSRIIPYIFQQCQFVMFICANFFYFLLLPKGVGLMDIIVVDILVVVRCSAIAAKYALVPRELYDKLHVKPIGNETLVDLLLLGGWSSGKRSIIEQELCNAERLLKTDLNNGFFFLEESSYYSVSRVEDALPVMKGLSAVFSKTIDGTSYIVFPSRAVAVQVLTDAYSAPHMRLTWMLVLTLGRIAIQIFSPLLVGDPYMFIDWQSGLVGGLIVLILFIFYSVDVGFSIAAVRDFSRRLYCMRQMNSLIGSGYRGHDCERTPLRLDLQLPDNIIGWLNCRHVLRAYARRWKLREESFLGAMLLFLVFIFIIMVMDIIFAPSGTVSSLAFKDMVLLGYDVIVFSTLISGVFIAAARCNTEFIRHKKTLRTAQAHVEADWWAMQSKRSYVIGSTCQGFGSVCRAGESKRDGIFDMLIGRYDRASKLLAAACYLVEEDDLSHPVTVMGVPPSMRMVRSMAGIIGGAGVALFQRFVGFRSS